jgi:hypothetical protein
MNVEFDKMLSCGHIVDVMNEMILVIYEMKRKEWKIEFEWDLYWNIVDYRFSKEDLILCIFGIIKRGERRKIGELRLRLDSEEYMVYGIELCIDLKGKELRRMLDCECILGCDRERMEMELDVSGWMCLGDSGAFVDEMYEEEEEE